MAMKVHPAQDPSWPQGFSLKKLSLDQIQHIDELLASLGEYGEVHLIIQHGELRYINKVESFSAKKSDSDV
jgi:hypothetical protein